MDNPYWYSMGKGHRINVGSIKRDCFNLLNIFEANRALHESFEVVRAEAQEDENRTLTIEQSTLLSLHLRYALKSISQLLLQIALSVRTYDDIMSSGEFAVEYLPLPSGGESVYLSTFEMARP